MCNSTINICEIYGVCIYIYMFIYITSHILSDRILSLVTPCHVVCQPCVQLNLGNSVTKGKKGEKNWGTVNSLYQTETLFLKHLSDSMQYKRSKLCFRLKLESVANHNETGFH